MTDRDDDRGSEAPRGWRRVAGLLARWPGLIGTVLLFVGGLAAAFFTTDWIARNGGQILALLSLVLLWRQWMGPAFGRLEGKAWSFRGHQVDRQRLVIEVLCPTLVLALVLVVFWRVFTGDAPLYNDHSNHFYQGWVMAERLLPTGRISGWVSTRGAGYPAGVLYPIGANLLIAGVRYLTFGALSWDMTYAVAFVLAMALCHLSAYTAGRLLGGPVAGLLAGVFSAIDAGAYRQAGWTFAVHWGVWPVCLSAALAVLSVVLLHRTLTRPGSRGLAGFALLAGAALVTHPMSLAFLALAIPAAIVHAMIEVSDRHPLRVAFKGVVAGATAVALSAFWLVPFLAYRAEARTLGTGATTLRHQLDALVRLTFFGKLWVVPMALAVLGAVIAWKTKRPGVRLLTLLLGGIALLFNGNTLLGLELDLLWSRLPNIQPDRFYLYLRIVAYVLAGVGGGWIVSSLRAAAPEARAHLGTARRWALTLVACVVFGTVVIPGTETLIRTVVANRLGWTGRPTFWNHYMAVADHIRADVERRGGFVRSVWPVPCPNRDVHCFQSSPAFTGIGHFHDHGYYTVCSYDRLFGMRGDDDTLRLLGVRYRVSRRARRGEQEVFRSGPLRLYEVPNVADEPFTLEGSGVPEGRLLEAGDERTRIEVSGATEGTRLVFHVPYFPAWQATLDGERLPIDLVDRASVRGLMRVSVPRDGVVELRYVRGPPEGLGAVATIVALLLCLAFARPRWIERFDRWKRVVDRVETWTTPARLRRASIVLAALSVALAVGGVLGYVSLREQRHRTFDTVTDFDGAQVRLRTGRSAKVCSRNWLGERKCGRHAHQWVGPRYVWTTMGFARGALYAHPTKGAVTEIAFPRVRLEESLIGGLGVVHGGGGGTPVDLDIHFGRQKLHRFSYKAADGWDRFRLDTRELAGKVGTLRFDVSSKRVNRRHFVFRAWTSSRPVKTGQDVGDRTVR